MILNFVIMKCKNICCANGIGQKGLIMKVYQALLPDGDILESDIFKEVYSAALTNLKYDIRHEKNPNIWVKSCRLCIAEYSDEQYVNEWGYYQSDLLNREEIGFIYVLRGGYFIDYNCGLIVLKGEY